MNQALRAVATGQALPREADEFGALLNKGFTPFSPDAWHVMQARDEQLIQDELLHGAASKAFVYDFSIQGNRVTGVSVVGARQLASEYGGIKSKIVATVEKRGALFIFRSFEPLSIHTAVLPELETDTDFYECVMQVDDIKTGNSTQVRKKETKVERKRDGGFFERPHFDVIAESKARRNGILDVLPQKVIEDFKKKHLAAGNASQEKTIDQLRAGAQQFAAKHGITLDRRVLEGLSYSELMGLGGAAASGVDHFRASAESLKLVASATGEVPPPPAAGTKGAGKRGAAKEPPVPPAATEALPASRSPAGGPDSGSAAPPAAPSYAAIASAITKAGSRDDALAELDAARDLPADQQRDLKAHLERTFPAEG